MKSWLQRAAFAGMFLLALVAYAAPATAQNILVNPGFESGLAGWIPFGNAYPEAANPPAVVPLSGNGVAKMFGNFTGGFDVTGIFQSFPTVPGQLFTMSSNARHWSGDPLTGIGAASCAFGCSDNWVVQKIVFKDAGNAEIAGASVESVILDGTYPTDTWVAAAPIAALAPIGAVAVEAFILFLQPAGHGGAGQFDDIVLLNTTPTRTSSSTWGRVKTLYR